MVNPYTPSSTRSSGHANNKPSWVAATVRKYPATTILLLFWIAVAIVFLEIFLHGWISAGGRERHAFGDFNAWLVSVIAVVAAGLFNIAGIGLGCWSLFSSRDISGGGNARFVSMLGIVAAMLLNSFWIGLLAMSAISSGVG